MAYSELIKNFNKVREYIEVKVIPKIPGINEYLDKSILSIKNVVRLLDDSHTPDWKELNQVFL